MSFHFRAEWQQNASGKQEVHVVLSTTGREFSPDLVYRATEEVICGIPASRLAMARDGEITSQVVEGISRIVVVPFPG